MSTDTNPPPPYSPSVDRAKEIKEYSALTIELDNQIDTLKRYVLDINPAYFQPSHKSEIEALRGDAERLAKLYVDYLWDDVRTGATDLEACITDFVNVILHMLSLPEQEVPASDKMLELKDFLERPPPKMLTSDNRLNQVLTMGQEIYQLSLKYTSLLTKKNGLEGNIAEGNRITPRYAYKPTEFNKIANQAMATIKVVPANINIALLNVYKQLKADALSFYLDLETRNLVNQDHVKDAQHQYKKVESALIYLATNSTSC